MYQDMNFSTFSGGGSVSPQGRITWGCEVVTGFDRLKAGLYVLFESPLFFESWQDVKQAALEADDVVPISFSDHGDLVFNMHPTGRRGGFGFHLSRSDVHIFVSTRKDIKTPNVWVDIGSESCWSPGWRHVLEDVKYLFETLGGRIWKTSVSEVHFCADFVGLDIEELPIDRWDHWVTRANYRNAYSNHHGLLGVTLAQDDGALLGEEMTGIVFGRGDIMLRIYDKTAELSRSPAKQGVFASVWNLANYDDQPTTRVEYQLRRPVLMQMKIDTLADLEEKRNAAWLYCTTKWTRLCSRPVDRNHNQFRIVLHPWWEAVARADISRECEPLARERLRASKDISTLVEQSCGCLLSVGTILDQGPEDLEGVIHYAKRLIEGKFRQMWENKDKQGRREFQVKMAKRHSEIWPMGFEPKPV